jgi:hypothetical protein
MDIIENIDLYSHKDLLDYITEQLSNQVKLMIQLLFIHQYGKLIYMGFYVFLSFIQYTAKHSLNLIQYLFMQGNI